MRRKFAAGNWKMNGLAANLAEIDALAKTHNGSDVDILIAPPATLIHRMSDHIGDTVQIGAQDCHEAETGAHTGDLSAAMLKDAGASYVIVGHSERRTEHAETDAQVRAKASAAMAEGLKVIICIGETLSEREAANTIDIIGGQMSGSLPDLATGENMVIAYEPVWAIGTGKIPTLDQIGEVHDFIRTRLERRFGSGVGCSVRILYGGSVKPGNAAEIFDVSNVDGALVGGASLKSADFGAIIGALEAAAE